MDSQIQRCSQNLRCDSCSRIRPLVASVHDSASGQTVSLCGFCAEREIEAHGRLDLANGIGDRP
jgi:hypothetical protein